MHNQNSRIERKQCKEALDREVTDDEDEGDDGKPEGEEEGDDKKPEEATETDNAADQQQQQQATTTGAAAEKTKKTRKIHPSEVYGSAHLLRLMVKMGGILNHSTICDPDDIAMVEDEVHELLTFLDQNRPSYFTSKNYSEAGQEYLAEVAKME